MRKYFNITGDCKPKLHYMVDLTQRLEKIKAMVNSGEYFVINRARQFGKTTTLKALQKFLADEYYVISLDFQYLTDEDFFDSRSFVIAFAQEILDSVNESIVIPDEQRKQLEEIAGGKTVRMAMLFRIITKWCRNVSKPLVLMIDEVDSASDKRVFLDFLGLLRACYINRDVNPTFQSVILAGVHDIRNLKQNIRPDSEHKHNSPWNIAAKFDIDMSFSVSDISGMLKEYENDNHTGMNIEEISQLIYDYTSGYPVLVTKICKYIDEDIKLWTKDGIVKAVGIVLAETNPLFESLINKIEDYPDIKDNLYRILIKGEKVPYSPDNESVKNLMRYGFVKAENNELVISNRIFETRLYNLLLTSEEMKNTPIFRAGYYDKPEFIKNSQLDMELILERFVIHFNDIYSTQTDKFIEDDGRKCFLLYLRPIINGVGNYYIEAQTRDHRRTDIIVDYLGQRYIIELKIWHGDKYNSDGEQQLADYLDIYHQNKGYLVTFSFLKDKKVGVKTVQYGDKTIVEATA